jgi:hypothetical protein
MYLYIFYPIIPSETPPMNDPQRSRYKFDYSSENGQMEAVSFFGYNIRFIKNPSHLIKLLAVQQNGRCIYYINEPDEMIQITAIKNNPYAIYDIKNPTDLVKEESMKYDISIRDFFSNKKQKQKWSNQLNIEMNTKEHFKLLNKIMDEAKVEMEIDVDTISTNSE